MHHFKTYLISAGLAGLLLFAGCAEGGKGDSGASDETTEVTEEKPNPHDIPLDQRVRSEVEPLTTEMSSYKENGKAYVTFYISNIEDLETLKVVLWEMHYLVEAQNPDAKEIAIIGYNPMDKVPDIHNDPSLAFAPENREGLFCSIDNISGSWTWSYGGMDADGNWKNSEPIE